MLETKMISFMKWTKDTMNNIPPDSVLDSLVAMAKAAGASHCEIAVPLGKSNSAVEMKRWADKIHGAGLLVTFRPADVDMEGIYGRPKAVGAARKPQQYYIDECVSFINTNPSIFKDGDEWCPFPERTEGIFQDATSWITPQDPATYANFFVSLADACKTAFGVKKVVTGLSTNNGSEYLSGWMNTALTNRAGYVCVDHYVDNDPVKLEADLRTMHSKYGKPIYLQETAPDRFVVPSAATIAAYFAVLQKLVSEGILARVGYWGGWPQGTTTTPEGCINADFTLNATGIALKTFFGVSVPAPTPDPIPVPVSKIEFVHKAGTQEYGIEIKGKYIAANSEESMRALLGLLLYVEDVYAFLPDGKIDFSKAKDIN